MPEVVPALPCLDIIELVDGGWEKMCITMDCFLSRQKDIPRTSLVFASSRTFLELENLRLSTSNFYDIPPIFWTMACQRSNGFFGCQDLFDMNGKLKSHVTWFRFIVKQNAPMETSYTWHEMSVHTKWTTNASIALCFDIPRTVQKELEQTLMSRPLFEPVDIYAMHIVILDEFVHLFDASVWAIRDSLRLIEKSRDAHSRSDTDYPQLHDFARHTIHSTETLGVALNTVDSMIRQQNLLLEKTQQGQRDNVKALLQTRQYMQFQHQMLANLKSRSEANGLRLQNEINLAFNVVAQSQNQTLLSINRATQSDGTAMKSVAVVTLALLPATFVSTLFSMSFFNFSPGSESGQAAWTMSKEIWIYWSIAVPLTAVTIGTWFYWQHRLREKTKCSAQNLKIDNERKMRSAFC